MPDTPPDKVSLPDDVIAAAALALLTAETTGQPTTPIAASIAAGGIEAAYAVQSLLSERRITGGARVIGRKIGLTSKAVQAQIGVDQPDFGVLFDDMDYASGSEIPMSRLIAPKAEAEIAFILGRDIPDASDPEVVRAAVDLAYPALEIVDSRIADWKIGLLDTVADNASSGVFVLGATGTPLSDFDTVAVTMEMTRNGDVVSVGTGADCLGDPLYALAWLAATAIRFGAPLRAGDIILSGALGPMATITAGDSFDADIAPLGRVSVRFSKEGA